MNKNHVNYAKKIGCSKETRPDYKTNGLFQRLKEAINDPSYSPWYTIEADPQRREFLINYNRFL